MWICPVCGADMDDKIYICTACGFDERKNFQKYPSLIPLDAAAVAAVEAMWRKSLQRENALKCEEVSEHGEALENKETLDREDDCWRTASFPETSHKSALKMSFGKGTHLKRRDL